MSPFVSVKYLCLYENYYTPFVYYQDLGFEQKGNGPPSFGPTHILANLVIFKFKKSYSLVFIFKYCYSLTC